MADQRTVLTGIPVNLPYLWKVLLKSPTDIRGFVNAGNDLLNDLFNDVNNYFLNNEPDTCKVFEDHLNRIVTFRMIPMDKYAALPSDDYRTQLYNEGFLVPSKYVTSTDPEYPNYLAGTYSNFKMNVPAVEIESLTDSLISPTVTYENDNHFFIEESSLYFSSNPLLTLPSSMVQYSTYTAPWGETFQETSLRLVGSNIKLSDSPLWNNFGGLVYTRTITNADDEAAYRNLILGLFQLYYRGASRDAINASLNMFLNMPVTLDNLEEVQYLKEDTIGIYTIRTDKNTYYVDSSMPVNPNVYLGAVLQRYTPLSTAIAVSLLQTDDEINGLVIPKKYLCRVNPVTHVESAITINAVDNQDLKFLSSTVDDITSYPCYDDMEYEQPYNGTVYPQVPVRSKTLWTELFSNYIFKIKINVAVTDSVLEFIDNALRDSIPIWSTYIIDAVSEEGQSMQYMNGQYLNGRYLQK